MPDFDRTGGAALGSLDATVRRMGVVLAPDGDPREAEGVLNPASARTRDGKLLVYPRAVAAGNISRVGLVEAEGSPDAPVYTRAGYALEPSTPSELRDSPGGYGCEDPRVTFVPLLDAYVMAYTAFGPIGPRIALALSQDGYRWERLGLLDFSADGLPHGDDKDGAFFPEPVLSPAGVRCFAIFHRPMIHIVAADPRGAAEKILELPPDRREATCLAYIPLEPALADRRQLLHVTESALVLPAGGEGDWGRIKNGCGTPPVRVAEGWFSVFHGVDPMYDQDGRCTGMRYSAGIMVQDYERPHVLLYRSPAPVLNPETADEMHGIVSHVVFPTGIDVPPGAPERTYDVYYGMADAKIGRMRIELGASVAADPVIAAAARA